MVGQRRRPVRVKSSNNSLSQIVSPNITLGEKARLLAEESSNQFTNPAPETSKSILYSTAEENCLIWKIVRVAPKRGGNRKLAKTTRKLITHNDATDWVGFLPKNMWRIFFQRATISANKLST
jgi:hypothetical protein